MQGCAFDRSIIFGSFRAKALIPIDKVDITDVNRVQGVGVSAQIDVKL
mgnify:CR=1 FL=1